MSRKAICLDIPVPADRLLPSSYARAQSGGASLRNAVAGAMRGHIKPVMVPFSRAITRSRCYLTSYRFRDSTPTYANCVCARGGHFFPRRRASHRIVSLFPRCSASYGEKPESQRARYALSCGTRTCERNLIQFI